MPRRARRTRSAYILVTARKLERGEQRFQAARTFPHLAKERLGNALAAASRRGKRRARELGLEALEHVRHRRGPIEQEQLGRIEIELLANFPPEPRARRFMPRHSGPPMVKTTSAHFGNG
jgi:hypothetical protein